MVIENYLKENNANQIRMDETQIGVTQSNLTPQQIQEKRQELWGANPGGFSTYEKRAEFGKYDMNTLMDIFSMPPHLQMQKKPKQEQEIFDPEPPSQTGFTADQIFMVMMQNQKYQKAKQMVEKGPVVHPLYVNK